MQPLFFFIGKQIKRSTQDVLSTRTTMAKPLLRIQCTTQTQKLLRGKSSALTPISTPSAPWFDVRKTQRNTTLTCLLTVNIYKDIYILPVSDDINTQKHKAHFQQHLWPLHSMLQRGWKMKRERQREGRTPSQIFPQWREAFLTLCECWLYE